MKQLTRKLGGRTYYCEFIGQKPVAKLKKTAAKSAGFKTRVFPIGNEYGLFISI